MKRIILILVIVVAAVSLFFTQYQGSKNNVDEEIVEQLIDEEKKEPIVEYGFEIDSFAVYKDVIQPNQFLANILLKYHIPYTDIDMLAKMSRDIFDVRKIASGKKYTILCSKDSLGKAQCFIYEPNETEYVVFDMLILFPFIEDKKKLPLK